MDILATTVTSEYKVLVPATPPLEPFAPRPKRSAILGLGAGLLAGAVLALLLDSFGRHIRGRVEVSDVLDLPVLGVIPRVARGQLEESRLFALTDSGGSAAESLRLLRSNLDYYNSEGASSLLVTSSIAGEGKSTTVCNLAITLALAGKKIVVVDGDLRKPRVHEYFGMTNYIGLTNVVAGSVDLVDAVRPASLSRTVLRVGGNGDLPPTSARSSASPASLMVLTTGPPPSDLGEFVASREFATVMSDLRSFDADLLIIDSPALLEVGDAAAMAAQVDALLLVVEVHKVGRSNLRDVKEMLAPLPCQKIGAVMVKERHYRQKGSHVYAD